MSSQQQHSTMSNGVGAVAAAGGGAAAVPPAPNGKVLSLISALSNTQNHELHVQAIRARDEALASSPESYSQLCLQLAYTMAGCDQPEMMISRIGPSELEAWRQTDMQSVLRLQQDPGLWVPFGQMAGLILKQALLRPPAPAAALAAPGQQKQQQQQHRLSIQPPASDHLKATLLFALGCQHAEIRAVTSTIIATIAVSNDVNLQPQLHVRGWRGLARSLIDNLQQSSGSANPHIVEGSLLTISKLMEDGPHHLDQEDLDAVVPVLVRFLASPSEMHKLSALQSIASCLAQGLMPSSLVLHFGDYLTALSALAVDQSPAVRKCVCRSIVTILEVRTEYIRDHLAAICGFMLRSTDSDVALEACEFWFAFANLEESAMTSDMYETVQLTLPELVPVLLRCMVYQPDQQAEILSRNELDRQEQPQHKANSMRPVFHRSKAGTRHAPPAANSNKDNSMGGSSADSTDDDGYQEDDEGDDEGWDDDDGNEWTLRKCAAASLDSLANLYGAEPILPCLLPALEEGLRGADPWRQEASILALGAISEGCCIEMSAYLGQLHPYLMNHLSAPESADASLPLPQIKCICAWTLGRYAAWAVEQVQMGSQGHLLAQMTELFMTRLGDSNRRVQVACCSGFGVVVEVAGDLMAPYLEPVYRTLVSAMARYQGRSLLMVFDVLGIVADCCGPAIAEGDLPSIYVPPLLRTWDGLAKNDPNDRTLLPLMECLASIAMTSGMNFQPYSLESFEMAMCTIETVTLSLTSSSGDDQVENEEDVDPIICAADLLDGLVEGLGSNFQPLVSSSQRYGPHFLNVLLTLSKHDLPGVRMSALALLGDLARNAPGMLEPALPQLLQEAIANMDPIQPSVSTNAVWAIGEVCVRCEGNDAPMKPFAATLMQNLIALLMGNGPGGQGRGTDIAGLAENAAACVGRLAKVNPEFVAPELSRFLLGWCDGMAKICDPTERRDAFQGFIKTVYTNPQAIQHAAANVADAIASILFAIITWHFPPDFCNHSTTTALLNGDYNFRPFPQHESELGAALVRLVQDMKASVGADTWHLVEKELPVNVRRLLREAYQL